MGSMGDVLRIVYIGLLGPFGALALLVSSASSAQPSCSSYSGLPQEEGDKAGMVLVGGGSFVMGSDRQHPEERSSHAVKVDGFWIDRHEVTNAQFARFVGATGYKTLAERGVDPKTHQSLDAPGSVLFIQPTDFDQRGRKQWWRYVNGANWRAPDGPGSSIKGRENHPVAHVAYEDALAYARWLGRELPPRRNGSLPRAGADRAMIGA
jgi:formylglycine-generating enzyme